MMEEQPAAADQSEATMLFCWDWIKKLRDDMGTLSANRQEALNYYFADNAANLTTATNRSKTTVSTIADTIEWVKPALLRIFTSGDEVTNLVPRGPEDVEKVKRQNELINYQIKVKNNWFIILHDQLLDALLLKFGGVKYQWFKKVDYIEKAFENLTDEEFAAKISEPDIKILEHQEIPIQEAQIDPISGTMLSPAVKLHNVTIQYAIEDEYPLIEAIPSEELGFPLDSRDVESMPFMYHVVKREKWEIIEKYGIEKFKEIENIANQAAPVSNDIKLTERYQDMGGISFSFNEKESKYYLYECYYKDPDNGTPKTTTLCGNVILSDNKNPYKKPPFRIFTPIKLAHRVCGLSMHDILKKLQDLQTSLMRQMLDNVYFLNNGRYVVDPLRVNMDDFLNNNAPGQPVRGDPSGIGSITPPPLPPWAFSMMEHVAKQVEYRSGVTRAFQSVDVGRLADTFRGQSQQITQASQRVELMARLFAEMSIAPLVRDILTINGLFLKKKTALKVLNSWVEISPDDMVTQCDVIVNVGLGTGNKDVTIMQMQQLLGLYGQIYKIGVPVVTADNIYSAMKELVRAMGYRNTGDYVTDPELVKSVTALVQTLMLFIQQTGFNDPRIVMPLQKVVAAMGMGNPQQMNPMATQEMPTNPAQPVQNMSPSVNPDGGGYFA